VAAAVSERPAVCQAIIDAAGELGVEYRPDVNNLPPGAGDSIGWCQQTRGGRHRASAAQTYLRPHIVRGARHRLWNDIFGSIGGVTNYHAQPRYLRLRKNHCPPF
jgi:hypothetical protein